MSIPRTVAVFLMLSGIAVAQPGAKLEDAKPQFEVASIKLAAPSTFSVPIRTTFTPGGRFTAINFTLKDLIARAWEIESFQLSGGPSWTDSVRYDISAKAENSPKWKERLLMVQTLLADRFQLTMHHETKQLPVYALVVGRKDGKLGPGLTESKAGVCRMADASNPPPRLELGTPSVPLAIR